MNIAVLGAGLAGLVAACDLADSGHRVTVLEKRPFPGGKTYSFTDRETGDEVDNGQHVFMTCTAKYVAFLTRLGTLHLTRRQKRLRVPVFDADGRRSDLRAGGLPAPLHFGPSFARYRHVAMRDKPGIGRLLLRARSMDERDRLALADQSFGDWLRAQGQSHRAICCFWDFILLPTLNCVADEASAADALFVIREGFLSTRESAAIGVSKVGLSRLHVNPAVAYLAARGGRVDCSTTVRRVIVSGTCATGIEVESRQGARTLAYDAVVSALPHRALPQVLPSHPAMDPLLRDLEAIEAAPIVNAHLWFDRPVAPFSMAAFVGNDLQWAFNPDRIRDHSSAFGQRVVFSLSGARRFMPLDRDEVVARLLPQVRRALPAARDAGLSHAVVIKEPDATFVPAPGIRRPGPVTAVTNLFLAGAYTDTGWPATMESAVRSGHAAARSVMHYAESGGADTLANAQEV